MVRLKVPKCQALGVGIRSMSKEDCVTPSYKHAAPEGGFDFIVWVALLTAYLCSLTSHDVVPYKNSVFQPKGTIHWWPLLTPKAFPSLCLCLCSSFFLGLVSYILLSHAAHPSYSVEIYLLHEVFPNPPARRNSPFSESLQQHSVVLWQQEFYSTPA